LNGAPSGPFTVPVIVAPRAKAARKIIALSNASIFAIRCIEAPDRRTVPV
jgi:hypothetical protein